MSDEPKRIRCPQCREKLTEIKRVSFRDDGAKMLGMILDKVCANLECQLGLDLSKVKNWEKT